MDTHEQDGKVLVGMGNASQTSVVCLHLFAPARIESSSGHTGI